MTALQIDKYNKNKSHQCPKIKVVIYVCSQIYLLYSLVFIIYQYTNVYLVKSPHVAMMHTLA